MLAGQLALTTAAIFTGAAVYISLCEQPPGSARRACAADRMEAVLQARRRHAGATGPSLAPFWALSPGGRRATGAGSLGAIVILSAWPYTLLVIKPTNDRLLATDPPNAGPAGAGLMENGAGCTRGAAPSVWLQRFYFSGRRCGHRQANAGLAAYIALAR